MNDLESIKGHTLDSDREFAVSRFVNKHDNKAKLARLKWGGLKSEFLTHARRTEKDGPLLSPARYEPGLNHFRRKNPDGTVTEWDAEAGDGLIQRLHDNVRGISFGLLDIEGHGAAILTRADLDALAGKLDEAGFAFILASTFSHRDDNARARLAVAFERELTPEELWPALRGLGALLAQPIDESCKDAGRMFFLSSALPGAPVFARASDGGATFKVEPVCELGRLAMRRDRKEKKARTADRTQKIPEGERRKFLTDEAVRRAREGASEEEILAHIVGQFELRCDTTKPRSSGDLEGIARWAADAVKARPPEPPHPAECESAYAAKETRKRQAVQPQIPETTGDLKFVRCSDVELESVEWLWDGRLPSGKITILDGDPGCGKTTIALGLAASISQGRELPSGEQKYQPLDVVISSAEDGLGDTLKRRIIAAGGDETRIHFVDLRDPESLPVAFPRDIAALEKFIREKQAALLIIDPLMAHLSANVDSHKDRLFGRSRETAVDLWRRRPRSLWTGAWTA